jgi:hypothetical protein
MNPVIIIRLGLCSKRYPVPVPTLSVAENIIMNPIIIRLGLRSKRYPVPVPTFSVAINILMNPVLSSSPSESPGDTPHVPQETPHVPAGYTPGAAGGGSRRH